MPGRAVHGVGRRHVRRTSSRVTKGFLGAFLGLALIVASGPVAQASSLPSQQSSGGAYQADGQVRGILSAGGRLWIGGQFSHLLTPSGGTGPAAPGIAALDPNTGDPVGGVSLPSLGGNGRFVYDFSEGPNGILYVAGNFTYQVGGHNYQNLIGIDPQTGQIRAAFNTSSLRSVYAMSDRVLVGGSALWAYTLGGVKIGSFAPIVPRINTSLRSHRTPPQIRDIGVTGGWGYAVGQFDWINNKPAKVAVRFDTGNGHVDSWELGGLHGDSAAFGISLDIDGSTLYVGAGGSDFTASYRASDGRQNWKTDTSGSTQVVTIWDTDTLIIGGHFDWVAMNGSGTCGMNSKPNKKCLNQPRLAALDASNGRVDSSWRPEICCLYNGTWALDVDHGHLNVGGEFTKAGGRTARFYAMFS
jgi:hypothetical protein